jgi:hypothetical protein
VGSTGGCLLASWGSKLFFTALHMYFDCNLSPEVRCGNFHLWHHANTQKVSILEHFIFWIFGLGLFNLYRVLALFTGSDFQVLWSLYRTQPSTPMRLPLKDWFTPSAVPLPPPTMGPAGNVLSGGQTQIVLWGSLAAIAMFFLIVFLIFLCSSCDRWEPTCI